MARGYFLMLPAFSRMKTNAKKKPPRKKKMSTAVRPVYTIRRNGFLKI
jgi:hypothetical protein